MGAKMPRSKVLKGVAHNIGHSFTGRMNYAEDDYSMGHILRFARKTELDTLLIDFVTGEGQPKAPLQHPVANLPAWYTKMFWDMVESSGSDRALVQSATLTLKYDLMKSQPGPNVKTRMNPYVCDVRILDDRGKTYAAHFDGWWYVDRARVRAWWNPATWFRS
jgi:hypothetical protein